MLVGEIDPSSATMPLDTPGRLVCAARRQWGEHPSDFWVCTRPAGHRGAQHVATLYDNTAVATWPRS